MADELKNQPKDNTNDQLLNLADQLASSNPPMPGIGGFDVSSQSAARATPPTESRKPVAGEIPAIRTLRGDIQEYTQKNKTSYFDIVAASQKKHPKIGTEWIASSFSTKTVLIAAGALAIILLFVGGYFIFLKKQTPSVPPAARPAPAIIYADNTKIIEYAGDNKSLIDEIQTVFSKPQLSNEFTYLPVKTQIAGTDNFLGLTDFFQAAGVGLPAEIGAAITTPFTFGAIDTFGENESVLLFKAVEYDRTLAALLAWEKTMSRDLVKLLPPGVNRDFGELKFKDIVVKNQDARILANLEGRPIMAYTIFNRKLVVIVSSKAALEAVIDKLVASPPNL